MYEKIDVFEKLRRRLQDEEIESEPLEEAEESGEIEAGDVEYADVRHYRPRADTSDEI